MNTNPQQLAPNLTESTIFWRTDTRALVGAVLLGIVSMLLQQISIRLDAVIWPPLIILGGIAWATLTGLITLIFRQPAGMIMGGTQAVIAVATGLSPVALFFIPTNLLTSLIYSAIAQKLSMEKWSHHLFAQSVINIFGNIIVGFGLYTILKLPVEVVIVSSAVTAAAGIVGATILTKLLFKSLRRAGLI